MKSLGLIILLLSSISCFGQFQTNVNKPEKIKQLEQYKSYIKLFKKVKKDSIKTLDNLILDEKKYLDSLENVTPEIDSPSSQISQSRLDSLERLKENINWDSLKIVYRENLKMHITRRVSDEFNRRAANKLKLPEGGTDQETFSQMMQPPGNLRLDTAQYSHPNKILNQQAQQYISKELKDNQQIQQINKKIGRYKKKFSRVTSLSDLRM